ncbi:hypothetical protein PIB30_071503, partial [Stylosanthes scabra]|nr:hypothetical protein [Stylosanthes scabra]
TASGVLRAAERVLWWLDLHSGGWIWTLERRLVDNKEAGEAGGPRGGWTTMRTLLHDDDVVVATRRNERVRSWVFRRCTVGDGGAASWFLISVGVWVSD